MIVEHVIPDEAADDAALIVENMDIKPGRVRIEYAVYEPPARKMDDVIAEKGFEDAAIALYHAVEEGHRGDPGEMAIYSSRLYLAMTAFERARRMYERTSRR